MKLIVGLGNPGTRYENTRHNVGSQVVDRVRQGLQGSEPRRVDRSRLSIAHRSGETVLLFQPGTYMNRSGEPTARLARQHELEPGDLLVIYDDLDLPVGRLRLRREGGAGGHRGMESMILHVGESCHRLRIGIGRPANEAQPVDEYVLEPFTEEESATIEDARSRATEACFCWLDEGIEVAMNRYNVA